MALPALYSEVCIPVAVPAEVVNVGVRAGTEEIKMASWVQVVTISNRTAV